MHSDQLDSEASQIAKAYQGGFAWFTVAFGLAVIVAYVATPFLVVNEQLSLWLGCCIMIVLTYMAYTVLHDAAHGSISGSHSNLRWINEWMGYGAAFVLMIPLTAHRHEHLTHHRNTNKGTDDPDHVVADMTQSVFHAARSAARVYSVQFRFYMANRWSDAPAKQNRQYCTEILVAVSARILFLAQGYWFEGLLMILVGGLGGVALLMYLFAYIVHRPHDTVGRYVDTSAIIAPAWCNGLVTWLWLFQNYHAIHHLYPRVPFYNYKHLFDQIKPAMQANGTPIYRLGLKGLQAEVASA